MDALQALADPTRRSIVETLASGERPVGELVARLSIRQSGVSRHLRILSDAGMVTVRAAGQQRIYALRAKAFDDLDAWVSHYRGLWEKRLDRFEAALRDKKQRRGR